MTVIIGTDFPGIEYPLDHPRIGWERLTGTVAASTAAAGFPASAAYAATLYDAWKPTAAPADWTLTFADAETVSFVGIAGHTIGTAGATVKAQRWDGAAYVDIAGATVTPSDDAAILFLFDPVSTERIRVVLTGAVAELGHVRAGAVMEWPRRAAFTGLPITEAQQVGYRDNNSVTGMPLGRTVQSDGLKFSMSVQNLSEAWRVAAWEAFRAHCDKSDDGCFFIATRPSLYPDDVAYAWLDESVPFERAKANYLISGSVELSCRGYRAP